MGTCAPGASVLTPRGLQGAAWAGPWGPATHATRHPSAAGQGPAVSLPRAVEHACPILVPINGRLCTMWARLFSCMGSFRVRGRTQPRPRKEEGAVLPQEKGALEPCEDRQGVPSRARPSGQVTAVPEGWGSRARMGDAALRALLKGPGRAPPDITVQPWRQGESGHRGSRRGQMRQGRGQRTSTLLATVQLGGANLSPETKPRAGRGAPRLPPDHCPSAHPSCGCASAGD